MELLEILDTNNSIADKDLNFYSSDEASLKGNFIEIVDLMKQLLVKIKFFGNRSILKEAKLASYSAVKKSLESECVLLQEKVSKLESEVNYYKYIISEEKEKSCSLSREENQYVRTGEINFQCEETDDSQFATVKQDEPLTTMVSPQIKRTMNTSPIVARTICRERNKALCISSKRKINTDNHDPDEELCFDNTSDSEFTIKFKNSPNTTKIIKKDTEIDSSDLSDDVAIVEPSPLPVSRHMKSRNLFFGNQLKVEKESDDLFKPVPISDVVLDDHGCLRSYKNSSDAETLSTTLPVSNSSGEEVLTSTSNNEQVCSEKSKNSGRIWELKKIRDVTGNRKLRQTTLATIIPKKKIDISTKEAFNGGLVGSSMNVTQNTDLLTTKDPQATFFEPPPFNKVSPEKDDEDIFVSSRITNNCIDNKLEKLQISPEKLEIFTGKNSFDYLTQNSPKYKHRRNAIRKKSERRQLPGQHCDRCAGFFEDGTIHNCNMEEDNAKCYSRHRDKYPIRAFTPLGLWNPRIETDDEVE